MEAANKYGSKEIITLSWTDLDSVFFDNHFLRVLHPEGQQPFFRERMYRGKSTLWAQWRKVKRFMAKEVGSFYQFEPTLRSLYWESDGKVYAVGSNKDLKLIFGAGKWPEIKKFMREHRIKLRKANKAQLAELMQFAENL